MLVCAFLRVFCARDRGCSAHPVFPAPSDDRGRNVSSQNSRETRGEIAKPCLQLFLSVVVTREGG